MGGPTSLRRTRTGGLVSSACCSRLLQAYREKHGEVLEQAQMVESAIARAESFSGGGGKVSATVIDAIVESARKMFDDVNGGFGAAPKFPHPAALDLVMDQYVRTGSSNDRAENQELRTIFVHTLEKMARGGVYDQLAGGFHRYSVDERWIVPHFEKMCYDNSELLKNYVHAYQATGDEFFAGGGARHYSLDGRMAQRPRPWRLLRLAGRRLLDGR